MVSAYFPLNHLRKVGSGKNSLPAAVIKIMAEISNTVCPMNNTPLKGLCCSLAAMVQDSIPYLFGKIQSFAVTLKKPHHPEALLIMSKMPHQLIKLGLASMPEGSMPHVMAKSNSLGKILIEPESPGNSAADLSHLKAVGHTGPVMVSRNNVYLSLMLQTAEALGMQNPVTIPLK